MRASRTIAGIVLIAGFVLVAAIAVAREEQTSTSMLSESFSDADLEFFERDVRPLLARRCFKCHGEKKQESSLRLDSRAGVLRGGDVGKVIVPASADQSRLIDAIRYDGDLQMPPDGKLPEEEIEVLTKWVRLGAPWPPDDSDANRTVEPFDLERRRRGHWAWQPVRDPQPPDVARAGWPRDRIDRFILARIEDAGIEPAAEADRRTWLRRVTYDLTGLPPTPGETDAFLADPSADAYETVVDRLLASPRFGERWARHWLDLVRYAETYGHEFDYQIPDAWRYRDYLIRALNADVPYDQFVTEHIAGDLLPEPRRHACEGFNESIIGTGFWWLGEATHAPTDVRGDEAGRIDNQIDVFSKTFLGLTVACARCHDHKFDAISTKDYYALAGFLQSSRRWTATLDVHRSQERLAREAHNLQQLGSKVLRESMCRVRPDGGWQRRVARRIRAAMVVGPPPDSDEESARQAGYEQRIQRSAASLGVEAETVERWIEAVHSEELGEVFHPFFVVGQVARALPVAEHIDESGAGAATIDQAIERANRSLQTAQEAWHVYERETELVTDFEEDTFGDWRTTGWAFGGAPTSAGEWEIASDSPRLATGRNADSGRYHRRLHGALRSPTFVLDHDTIHYRVRGEGAKIRLIVDGYFMARYSGLLFGDFDIDVDSPDGFNWQVQAGDVHRYTGHRAYIEIEDAGDGYVAVDEIRFSNRHRPPPIRPSPLALKLAEKVRGVSIDDLCREAAAELARAVEHSGEAEATPDDVVLVNWLLDNALFAPPRESAEEMANQLAGLRERVQEIAAASSESALVVAMTDGSAENERVHVRGSHRNLGEVVPRRLPEALGGEVPPADEPGSGRLLLAKRVASPDNPLTARVMVNRIWHHLTGRGIVASVDNFGAMGEPPTHPKLLDHLTTRFVQDGWSIKRLIRAIVLSSTYRMASTPTESGRQIDPANRLLHSMRIRRLEGEANRDAILAVSGRLDPTMYGPSVAVHLTPFMQGRGRPARSGPADGDGRRSLYISVRRNFLSPMMLAFDTPIPFTTIGRRNTSNVPAQALILMNDPFVADQARRWAKHLLEEPHSSPEHRVDWMYRQALGRPPTPAEVEVDLSFLQRQAEQYEIDPQSWQAEPRVWADLCHVLLNVKEFILVY